MMHLPLAPLRRFRTRYTFASLEGIVGRRQCGALAAKTPSAESDKRLAITTALSPEAAAPSWVRGSLAGSVPFGGSLGQWAGSRGHVSAAARDGNSSLVTRCGCKGLMGGGGTVGEGLEQRNNLGWGGCATSIQLIHFIGQRVMAVDNGQPNHAPCTRSMWHNS